MQASQALFFSANLPRLSFLSTHLLILLSALHRFTSRLEPSEEQSLVLHRHLPPVCRHSRRSWQGVSQFWHRCKTTKALSKYWKQFTAMSKLCAHSPAWCRAGAWLPHHASAPDRASPRTACARPRGSAARSPWWCWCWSSCCGAAPRAAGNISPAVPTGWPPGAHPSSWNTQLHISYLTTPP